MDVHQRKTFSQLFPPPQFLSLATAGVSTADDEVNFAELKRSMFGRQLTPSFERITGTNIAGSLKNIATKYGARFVNATIPDEKAYLFTASIDAVPEEGLYDAAAFLVEGNVPVTLAESVFSYEVIEKYKNKTDGAEKIKLAVTVVPKLFINTQLQIFQSAGITVVSFDTESQAVARAVVPKGDMRTQLIINLTDKKAGFFVVESGVAQFSTTLNRGMDGQLSEIKAKANEIFSFWASRTTESGATGGKIEKMLLCGILPEQSDFTESLASMVNAEIVQANIWSNMSSLQGKITANELIQSSVFAAAIGAGLPH